MHQYVIADIHGRYDAMLDAIGRSPFDPKNDFLINLGDIVDGGAQTKECIEYMVNLPHQRLIIGNHDDWCLQWMKLGTELPIWVHQGGFATLESYGFDRRNVPESHVQYLESGIPYWIDDQNNIYVHGGFNPNHPIREQDSYDIMWDRDLLHFAESFEVPGYHRVFVGQTTTQLFRKATVPLQFHNLLMCDTGGGWNGKVTILDTETLEYWQSETQTPNRRDPDAYVYTLD